MFNLTDSSTVALEGFKEIEQGVPAQSNGKEGKSHVEYQQRV